MEMSEGLLRLMLKDDTARIPRLAVNEGLCQRRIG